MASSTALGLIYSKGENLQPYLSEFPFRRGMPSPCWLWEGGVPGAVPATPVLFTPLTFSNPRAVFVNLNKGDCSASCQVPEPDGGGLAE